VGGEPGRCCHAQAQRGGIKIEDNQSTAAGIADSCRKTRERIESYADQVGSSALTGRQEGIFPEENGRTGAMVVVTMRATTTEWA